MTDTHARHQLQPAALNAAAAVSETPAARVVFVCTHNAGRSQMAFGFFQHLAGDHAVAWSGGSEPGDAVNPAAIAAMRGSGIDISGEYPKPWTDEIERRMRDLLAGLGVQH